MKLFVLLVLVGIVTAEVDDDHVVNKEFLDGYNKFTADVYSELKTTNADSFVVSPLSANIILALAEYGSKGETSKQLTKGLSLPENKAKLHEAIRSLTPKLNVHDLYTLTSANKVYVKENYRLNQNFKKFAVDVYNADVENINFEKKESAAENINKWVEDKTQHKITNLVDKDDLDEDTRAVLINALYLSATWKTKFDKYHTKKDFFYLENNSKTQVDLMFLKSSFKYYEDHKLNAKFLEIPYAGRDVSLTIVLPNENDGLKHLEDKIGQVLEEPNYKFESVNLKLPKFKIETKIDFKPILEKFGIVNAFDDRAEFPDITEELLKISKVVQKAVIDVNEDGTTAAAATAVIMPNIRAGHIVREPKEFVADHAFAFFVKFQNVVLFAGHYTGK